MNDVLFPMHLTLAEIELGMSHVLASPKDYGTLEMIVARPAVNKRKVLSNAELEIEHGLSETTGSTAEARARRMAEATRKCS
jgi:hypothetical protein